MLNGVTHEMIPPALPIKPKRIRGQRRLSESNEVVILLLSNGLTCEEIAAKLKISYQSVYSRTHTIKRAMQAKNITHAVALYWKRLLV